MIVSFSIFNLFFNRFCVMSDFFVRADGTYLIEGLQGDNPKLLGRELVDGRDSLYLEFYLGCEVTMSRNGRSYTRALRRQEKLGLFLWRSPRSAQERRHNKEVLERARIVYFERRQEMLLRGGKSLSGEYVVDVIAWMRSYLDRYEMADRRCVKRASVVESNAHALQSRYLALHGLAHEVCHRHGVGTAGVEAFLLGDEIVHRRDKSFEARFFFQESSHLLRSRELHLVAYHTYLLLSRAEVLYALYLLLGGTHALPHHRFELSLGLFLCSVGVGQRLHARLQTGETVIYSPDIYGLKYFAQGRICPFGLHQSVFHYFSYRIGTLGELFQPVARLLKLICG